MDVVGRRRALYALFLIPGLALASWTTRSPAIRDEVNASTAEMGLILFGLSIGSMAGVLSSGLLVSRCGSRPVIAVATSFVMASLPTIVVSVTLGSGVGVAAGLAVFGIGMGWAEIAMNIDCADIEFRTGRTVMPTMHGFFSLGAVIGAVGGIAATALGLPLGWHFLVVAVVGTAILSSAVPRLHADVGRRAADKNVGSRDATRGGQAVWKDRQLLLIGAIVCAMAFAEGAATDWLPLIMVDGHGVDEVAGSVVYALFTFSVALGRFGGGWLANRFDRAAVLRGSAIVGSTGLLIVICSDSAPLASIGSMLWGLGISLGFPLAVSAAGASGPSPTARVALVSTIGYLALLVGPPALGVLGEAYDLRVAMIAVLIPIALVTAIASSASSGVQRKSNANVVDLEGVNSAARQPIRCTDRTGC